ncbi:hypothetical protein [Pedobacter metabolipauper]|uniref:Uncharacterized protein n=1 Tax=Pedobacter metabolipauper TaxID=425513 RepID=A0A4R6SR85_9SPHI|nr:hypothetical protein [Pedobacter metabolipauper]TDQ06867.1 hypothetical protein ATK78_3879 [Pedobacter metabolipauper]
MKRILSIPVILLFCISCNPSAEVRQKDNYFDIKDYFNKEITRLSLKKPVFTKTVAVDTASETKTVNIKDWKRELSAFTDADLNKASWKGLFKVQKNGSQEVYTSDHEKVPVKKVTVFYKGTQVKGFNILIRNNNSLYTSTDSLTYYADSIYRVKKTQHIRLLSPKVYTITGKFK